MSTAKEIIMEAAKIVAQLEHTNKTYVLATYSPTELFRKAKQYNREREANMDAIRANW